MARGGKRIPDSPAPVSGPGALSQRTDGGAGQPIRVPTGGAYGSAQALETQQQAAPLASADSPSPVEAGAVARQPAPPVDGVFGPTTRPNEDPLTGTMPRSNAVAGDVQGFLNVLYSQFPHPAIARLIEMR